MYGSYPRSFSGEIGGKKFKSASCRCGLCFDAPSWPTNSTRIDNNQILLGSADDALSRQIMDLYETRKQTMETTREKEDFCKDLSNVVSELKHSIALNNPEIVITGSTKYMMATDDSDLDICIASSHPYCYSKRHALSTIGDALKKKGLILYAPVIHGLERAVMKLTAAGRRNFRVDIQIIDVVSDKDDQEPINTTDVLLALRSVDRRFRILAILVKIWAKKQNIHDAADWKLSSYALMLILIQYLQIGCDPPVLPLIKSSSAKETLAMFRDNSYCSSNKQSLGDLLVGFFRFYSEKFDFDKQAVSVQRDGRRCKEFPAFDRLIVENLFTRANSARSVKYKYIFARIKEAFRNSYKLLRENGNLYLII